MARPKRVFTVFEDLPQSMQETICILSEDQEGFERRTEKALAYYNQQIKAKKAD